MGHGGGDFTRKKKIDVARAAELNEWRKAHGKHGHLGTSPLSQDFKGVDRAPLIYLELIVPPIPGNSRKEVSPAAHKTSPPPKAAAAAPCSGRVAVRGAVWGAAQSPPTEAARTLKRPQADYRRPGGMGRRWAMVAVAWWVLTLSAETRPTASGAFAPPMLGLSGLERRQFPSMHALRNAAPRRSSSGGCIMSWRLPKGTRSEVDSRAMKVDPALLAKYGVRIASIASLVKTGSSVIDVGCDHGLLSIGLVASGTASRVIASDANELPLENARRNLGDTSSAISEKVEVRLGDGLKVLSHGEVDTACICGMGGPTISEILFGSSSGGHFYALSKESGNSGGEPSTGGLPSRLGIERLIMQPTAYPEQLRSALHAHGWRIDDEVLTCDGRWAHIVISATRDGDQQDLALEHSYEDVLLGPILKNETSEVWGLWVDHQLRHYELKLFGLQRSGQSGEELQHAEQCVEILQRTKARLRDLKA